jgi:hypothetical protein
MVGGLVSSLVGGGAALLGSFLGHRWTLSRDLSKARRDERIKAYADLMGIRGVVQHFYLARLEALAWSDYYEAVWIAAGRQENSRAFDEGKRFMIKSEEYVDEAVKATQRLCEILGTIEVLFPKDEELSRLVAQLYRTPDVHLLGRATPVAGLSLEALGEWRDTRFIQVNQTVAQDFTEPIDRLVRKLGPMVGHNV